MAISVGVVNATTYGVNSLSPTLNADQVVGDMLLLIAGGKPYDLGWSVGTSGWTALSRGQSGTTAAGVDTGSMALQVWYKEATTDPETAPTVTEGTPAFNVAGAVLLILHKGAGEAWETPVVVYGADETSGTGVSVTYASDPGVTANDLIVTVAAINTDAMGPLTDNLTPSQTGVTFGTTTERVETETTGGGDMALHVSTTPVNSGTSSAAPTATGTGTASGGADRLESAFIRLRVSTSQSATPTPAVVAALGAVPAPAILDSEDIAAGVVAAIGAVPVVTVETGSPATVPVGVVAGVAAVPSATVDTQTNVAAGVVAAVATVPAVTISTTADIAAPVVAATASVPPITVDTGGGSEPEYHGSALMRLIHKKR